MSPILPVRNLHRHPRASQPTTTFDGVLQMGRCTWELSAGTQICSRSFSAEHG